MINLTQEQQKICGFTYCLNLLSFNSPLGEKLTLKPFLKGEEEELRDYLQDIGTLIENYPQTAKIRKDVSFLLMQTRVIEKTLLKCGGLLDEVELFEIKRFLLTCEKMLPLISSLRQTCAFKSHDKLKDVKMPLLILDPEGLRAEVFFISGKGRPQLKSVREQKKILDAKLKTLKGSEREECLALHGKLWAEEKELEGDALKQMCDELEAYKEDMLFNYKLLGAYDLLLAKAELATKYHCARPQIVEENIAAKQMILPHIKDRLEKAGGQFTPLDIEIEKGATVLTGANMGGKTVALKSLLVNCLLMQFGFYVFAESFSSPLFEGYFYLPFEGEKEEDGLSGFACDVVRLNGGYALFKDKNCLVVMDEFARGTNAAEGEKILAAVVKTLNKTPELYALLTTHYDNVAPYAAAHYQTGGLRQEGVKGQNIGLKEISRLMDYGLKRVSLNSPAPKDAIEVCRLLGLSDDFMSNF